MATPIDTRDLPAPGSAAPDASPRRTHYDQLQVTPTADPAVVDAAYSALVRIAEAEGRSGS